MELLHNIEHDLAKGERDRDLRLWNPSENHVGLDRCRMRLVVAVEGNSGR